MSLLPSSRLHAIACGCAMICLLGGCIGQHADLRQDRTVTLAYQNDTRLKVRTSNGSVRVDRREGSQVTIHAEFMSDSQGRLDQAQVIAAVQPDGVLLVESSWPGGRRDYEGCSFEIGIPGVTGIDLKSQNGGLSIAGFTGEAKLETSNGSIEATDHRGSVRAHTRNGAVTLKGIAGDAAAETSNGRVEVDGVSGAANASTANGAVHIRLDDASPGPVTAQTSNGGITLILGKSFVGQLEMATSNSGIHFTTPPRVRTVSVDDHSARLSIGESKAVSRVRTSNGSVRVEFSE